MIKKKKNHFRKKNHKLPSIFKNILVDSPHCSDPPQLTETDRPFSLAAKIHVRNRSLGVTFL